MRRFLLVRELPAIFAVCVAGAVLAFGNGQSVFGGWLCAAALWCALMWMILMPWPLRIQRRSLRHTDRRHQPDHRQQRANQQQRQKRCTTA